MHNQTRWRDMEYGEVVAIESDWVRTFAIFPVKTVNKNWTWLSTIYSRRVWIYTGFCDEPETQYGNIFDVLGST